MILKVPLSVEAVGDVTSFCVKSTCETDLVIQGS